MCHSLIDTRSISFFLDSCFRRNDGGANNSNQKTMEISLTFARYCVIIFGAELPAATSCDEPDSADGRSTASGYLTSEVVSGKTSIQHNK